MKLRLKVLVSILVALALINGALIVYDIRQEMKNEQQLNNQIITNIYKQLKKLNSDKLEMKNNIDMLIDANQRTVDVEIELSKSIKYIPRQIVLDKLLLENKLKQVNIMVKNRTMGGLGSGVSLKYKDNYYILSAGHMAQTEEDELELWENDSKVCDLEIVKQDFTIHDMDDGTKGNDLILLRPKDKKIILRYYVELADIESTTSTEVYIVGNPMGIEDVVSEGRIAMYLNNFMYLRDGCYFGNSGGGVYSLDGQLLGIVSHLSPQQPNPAMPAWLLDGIVRLNTIKVFMKDVK